jgi:sortase (surface protein transpeptidase)
MNADTKLLTLSTCIGNHDYRYLVQGVLVKDEQTK